MFKSKQRPIVMSLRARGLGRSVPLLCLTMVIASGCSGGTVDTGDPNSPVDADTTPPVLTGGQPVGT
ncbi:MAG: hypothetical protein AAB426_00725, partial [Myxococcota bacterium]